MDSTCLFCKIVAGEIGAAKVYEDDDAIAFLDIHPVNPGHTLIVPKEHSRNFLDIPKAELAALAPALSRIPTAVKNATGADGISIQVNNEPAAGQVIFHTHIHIIPRSHEDGLKLWHGRGGYAQGEIEHVAEKIKSHLKN